MKYRIKSTEIPSDKIIGLAEDFLSNFPILEALEDGRPLLLYDEKSKAYYCSCHLKAIDFCDLADFNASIDDNDDEESYKLNRNMTENESAFMTMMIDAKAGRSFEDIVIEFDKNYNEDLPLKIYGGQHRVKAIQLAKDVKPNTYHGFRVYFGLTKEQKVEIATINNTSITVSNDLLDRMREQLLGSELRNFFQLTGLLQQNQDFADKKDTVIPTVRAARTFIVNYWRGRNSVPTDFHAPIVCKSGGTDEDYMKIRSSINWDDPDFIEAGKKFAQLHQTQRLKVTTRRNDSYNQYASKALSLTVIASWSYAAGLYNNRKDQLNNLYKLTENLGANEDPLNAKALSEAKLKGIDNDTYRGLGTRFNAEELGRMLEVFIVLIDKGKKITKELANAAIMSYQAKKATNEATKSLSKI